MANDVTAVRRSAIFANVLNTPISKLAVGSNVDTCEDFFNTWTLD